MKLSELSELSRLRMVGEGDDAAVGTAGGNVIGRAAGVCAISENVVHPAEVGIGGGDDGIGLCS